MIALVATSSHQHPPSSSGRAPVWDTGPGTMSPAFVPQSARLPLPGGFRVFLLPFNIIKAKRCDRPESLRKVWPAQWKVRVGPCPWNPKISSSGSNHVPGLRFCVVFCRPKAFRVNSKKFGSLLVWDVPSFGDAFGILCGLVR